MISLFSLTAATQSRHLTDSTGWPLDAAEKQRKLMQARVRPCGDDSALPGKFIVRVVDHADHRRLTGGSAAAYLMKQLREKQQLRAQTSAFVGASVRLPNGTLVSGPQREEYVCDLGQLVDMAGRFEAFPVHRASPDCIADAAEFPGAEVQQDCLCTATGADDAHTQQVASQVQTLSQNTAVTANSQTTAPWHLDRIDQASGSDALDGVYATGSLDGAGVDIYVVDTGIKRDHAEYASRVVGGTNVYDGNDDFDDCHGHGTHCAGLAAGLTYGAAKGASLYGVKVLSCTGAGSTSGVIAGLDWVVRSAAATGRPSVVSMSLGGARSPVLNAAVAAVVGAGVTVVVAAGNAGRDADEFSPASVASAITVGAADFAGGRASFSNYGPVVDVFAPGTDVESAWVGAADSTKMTSGTSAACPLVAGAAALEIQLMMGTATTITPSEVEPAILADATTAGFTTETVSIDGGSSATPAKLLRVPSVTFAPTLAPAPTPPVLTPAPTHAPTDEGAVHTAVPTPTPTAAPTAKSDAPTPAPGPVNIVEGQVDQGDLDDVGQTGDELDAANAQYGHGWTLVSGGAHCRLALAGDTGRGVCIENAFGTSDGQYTNNEACEFVYRNSDTSSAASLVTERFDVEYHSLCGYDWLQIDGGAKYCGTGAQSTALPNAVAVAAGGVVSFSWRSDGSARKAGFRICDTTSGFTIDSQSATTSTGTAVDLNAPGAAQVCAVRVSAELGVCVQDDGGANSAGENYATREDCAFTFRGNTNSGDLSFTHFGLESHPTCDWDWLRIGAPSSGMCADGKAAVKGGQHCDYCGLGNEARVPATNVEVQGSQTFSFHSDYSVVRQGFQLCYKPTWFDASAFPSLSGSSVGGSSVDQLSANTMSVNSIHLHTSTKTAQTAQTTMTDEELAAEQEQIAAKQQKIDDDAQEKQGASTAFPAVSSSGASSTIPGVPSTNASADAGGSDGFAFGVGAQVGVAIAGALAVGALALFAHTHSRSKQGQEGPPLPITMPKPMAKAMEAAEAATPVRGEEVEQQLAGMDLSSQV